MTKLPDNIKSALEFAIRTGYNKGKSDGIRGNSGPETIDQFVKSRLEQISKLI